MHLVPIHPRTLMSIDKLGNRNIYHQHHLLVSMVQESVVSFLLVYKLIKGKYGHACRLVFRPQSPSRSLLACLSVKVHMARAPESRS